jgi:FtsH-binding integral membrane protein
MPGIFRVGTLWPPAFAAFQGESSVSIGSVELAARLEKETSTTKQLKAFLSRYFYLCMALAMAGLVVWGFSRTVDASLFHANPPRPLLLWIHGAAFSTWVVFFIVQSALVRVRKVSVHRFLGWFGAGLAAVMIPLGFAIAIIMARFDRVVHHQADADAFLSIPFYDMIAFGTCIALAIYWRKRPDFHRRLVFIATCGLMDAALGRFDYLFNHNLFYPALDLLILLGMGRDLVVDRRVGKVYLYALPLLIVGQSLSVYMWRINPPWWQSITHVFMT